MRQHEDHSCGRVEWDELGSLLNLVLGFGVGCSNGTCTNNSRPQDVDVFAIDGHHTHFNSLEQYIPDDESGTAERFEVGTPENDVTLLIGARAVWVGQLIAVYEQDRQSACGAQTHVLEDDCRGYQYGCCIQLWCLKDLVDVSVYHSHSFASFG